MASITEHLEETRDEHTNILAPQGPCVWWSGVMSGFFMALAVLMLMGALGLAIGVSAVGDPRQATGEAASELGIGAGIWAIITLLVAMFLGGMVSTKVTDPNPSPGPRRHDQPLRPRGQGTALLPCGGASGHGGGLERGMRHELSIYRTQN